MNENEMCNIFLSYVHELGFESWNEFENWDIVLRRGKIVIGVEAKLERNLHLLRQLSDKDNVNFKLALVPLLFDNRRQNIIDWIIIAQKLKILLVQVADPTKFSKAKPVQIYEDYSQFGRQNLFYYRHRPKHLLKLPDFTYENPAGVPAPRSVTTRNIALVKLEIFALERDGYVTLDECRQFGFRRAPWSFSYDWGRKMWKIRAPIYRGITTYPHIYSGLTNK